MARPLPHRGRQLHRIRHTAYGNTYTGREQIRRFIHAFSDEERIDYTSHCGTREVFALEWMWSGVATGPIRIHERVFPATGQRSRCRASRCAASRPTA
jgi:hypothetical protein